MSRYSLENRRKFYLVRTNKNGPLINKRLGKCWLYAPQGEPRTKGYGPHRVVYQLFVAEIPEGKDVCHHCDNPACIRPSHLFVGTRQENMLDCTSKGRHKSVTKPESVPRGDKHFARSRPELLARGETHGLVRCPEKAARGDKNGSRTHPERLIRGDDHFLRKHPEVVQGERNGRATLTNKQVKEIRKKYRPYINNHKPSNQRELAAEYGVAIWVIGGIVKGKTWRSVK